MKSIARILSAVTVGSATSAFAASGAESDGMGIVTILFLGFGALIVMFQLFPGVMLFCSMVKGLMSKAEPDTAKAKGN